MQSHGVSSTFIMQPKPSSHLQQKRHLLNRLNNYISDNHNN